MKKIIVILFVVVLISGCTSAYNSRNLLALRGQGMRFSQGLIVVEPVDSVVLLRETNAGKGEVIYNIPSINQYLCADSDPEILVDVCEELEKENIDEL